MHLELHRSRQDNMQMKLSEMPQEKRVERVFKELLASFAVYFISYIVIEPIYFQIILSVTYPLRLMSLALFMIRHKILLPRLLSTIIAILFFILQERGMIAYPFKPSKK